MARTTTTRKKPTTTRKSTAKTPARSTKATASTTTAKAASTTRSTATKAASSKGVAAASKAKAAPAEPAPRELKRKEFLDRVAQASGLKKPQARAAVDAALEILGDAMSKGEAINLEPLGKLKVQKEKDAGSARIYALRVRRKKTSGSGGATGQEALAKAAE